MSQEMYKLAQKITDDVMGQGTYVELNKFDPARGETRMTRKGVSQDPIERRLAAALRKALAGVLR